MNELNKVSVLITAWKEQKSIGECISCIALQEYSGIPNNFEILLACPDKETHQAALKVVKDLKIEDKFKHFQDLGVGKPTALNMLMNKSEGDVWIFTDGDVHFEKNAVKQLLNHFEDSEVKMVTGRPKSADSKQTIMGYFGHLLSDAAHHKRTIDLTKDPKGRSVRFIKKRPFFPVSGYIYAMRPTTIRYPNDTLVDDAFISYEIFNQGGLIKYEPQAIVMVKYPRNLRDYFKQKKRSTGGYIQLWEFGVVKPETKTRSFWRELEYFWYPIAYAKNLQQLFFSLLIYPVRLWLWIQIYWERKVIKKDFVKTWVRIESTK